MSFYSILTNTGQAKIAAAIAAGTDVNISHMAVGDGNGNYYEPTPTQTALVHEVWRGAVDSVAIDSINNNWVVINTIIPITDGDFWVREVGIFDTAGDLIAVGKYPATYKPLPTDTVAKNISIKLIIEVSDASVVNILVDESMVYATLENLNSLSSSVETEINQISASMTKISVPASQVLAGDVSLTNTVILNGFGTFLYTGNTNTLPTINLGMDLESQWGNDASEKFGWHIEIKSRSAAGDWIRCDSIRGNTKYISSNTTAAEQTDANLFTLSTAAGVTTLNIGTSSKVNTAGVTYVVTVQQTTHRRTGTTNQGKAFTEHYNPFMGFTAIKHEGSGLAGHEIPHFLGRKLGLVMAKNLTTAGNWSVSRGNGSYMPLNLTDAETTNTVIVSSFNEYSITVGSGGQINASTNQHIMYGWANSYFDEKNTLIGNYKIGTYVGTGDAGNKVTTRGKPAWVMIKRLDSTANWVLQDNQRPLSNYLNPNTNSSEGTDLGSSMVFENDGILLSGAFTAMNASGGQYLYMVVYDNDTGSGKSKYTKATETSNVQIQNRHLLFSEGIQSTGGFKNTAEVVVGAETITPSNGWSNGYNYIKKIEGGSWVSTLNAPSFGTFTATKPNDNRDVFLNGSWYASSNGVELITNGTFNVDTSGWTAVTCTLSVENGRLKQVNGSGFGYAYQAINTVIGKKYKLKGFYQSDGTQQAQYRIGTTIAGYDLGIIVTTSNTNVSAEFDFIATTTITYITLQNANNTSGLIHYYDDISVFALEPIIGAKYSPTLTYLNKRVLVIGGDIQLVEDFKYPDLVLKNVKAEIFDGEHKGKNACTAWVTFDGSTTPPTIKDSYNISSVIRTATGYFDVYLKNEMDNNTYALNLSASATSSESTTRIESKGTKKFSVSYYQNNGTAVNPTMCDISVLGGKN